MAYENKFSPTSEVVKRVANKILAPEDGLKVLDVLESFSLDQLPEKHQQDYFEAVVKTGSKNKLI